MGRRMVLALALLGLTTMACAATMAIPTPEPTRTEYADCMSAPNQVRGVPVVAVLDDVSGSDSGPALDAERRMAFRRIVDAAIDMGAILVGDVIASDRSHANRWAYIRLGAEGINDLARRDSLDCKRRGLSESFDEVLKRRSQGPTDVFLGLQILSEHLEGMSASTIHVVLLSDMLQSAPPVNLARKRTYARGSASVLAKVAREHRLIRCLDWRVHAVGAGRLSSGAMDGGIDDDLKEFWTSYFDACHGKLVTYDTALGSFP